MIARLGVAAGFGFPVHPHMLRHACGFKLANDGVDTRSLQAYLGHKNIQHTVRYTELAPDPLQELLARLIGLARLMLVTSIISCDVPRSSYHRGCIVSLV